MDRSSNAVKIEKIRRALEAKNFDTALAIAKTVDTARIKSAADLSVIAEAYEKNGVYDIALVYYEQIYLKSKTRRILIHLINLCLKQSMADMAELYLRDFSEMAPKDFYRYIFRYNIDKLRGEDLDVLIYDLEQLKAENFMEDWAYELAKLYHKSGQSEKCISECNDIVLWFGNGMYVERARGLRAIHLSRLGRAGGNTEAGIAKEVRRLINEGKSMQELENFIEEATLPDGNTHYSEEEYNQERFGKPPVYEEEGKDIIWNTQEFGTITEEMIRQQNTMDLLQGMQVAQQLRMQIGAGQEMEIEKPEETAFAKEESAPESRKAQESFSLPKTAGYWDVMHPGAKDMDGVYPERNAAQDTVGAQKDAEERIRQEKKLARDRRTEQELYRMLEQNESEEELSKAIRKLAASGEDTSAQTNGAEEKQATKRFRFWRRAADQKEEKDADAPKAAGLEKIEQEKMQAVEAAEEKETLNAKETAPKEETSGRKEAQENAWQNEGAEPAAQKSIPGKPVSELEAFRAGAKILSARVGISGFAQDVAKEEELLPKIPDFDLGVGEAAPQTGFEEPEPKVLYEYPQEIMADYAKEAPTLNACLRKLGMKVEEFFGGFLASPDMRRQLFRCMERILTGRNRAINIIVTGEEKSGKTTLAKAIAKCTQVLGGIQSPRVALIRGDKLNHIHLRTKKEQLRGSTMLVEKASLMSEEKVKELLDLDGELAGETAVILEDERSHMNMFLRKNEELLRVYNNRIDLPKKTPTDLFLQALSMLYQNEYTMTESVAGEFLAAVRDCIQENMDNGYDAVCKYTGGVLKRAERRMAQMLREFALDGKYKEEELTMLREEDLYEKDV